MFYKKEKVINKLLDIRNLSLDNERSADILLEVFRDMKDKYLPIKIEYLKNEGILATFNKNPIYLYLRVYNSGEIDYSIENLDTDIIDTSGDIFDKAAVVMTLNDFFNTSVL